MTSTTKVILGIVGAAAAGAVIGMMLAPEKGSDIRQRVKDAANDWACQLADVKSKVSDLTESITDYLETSYKLAVLNVTDKATAVVASVMASFVVLFLGLFVILFGGIALGVWLGDLLNSEALGYLLVAVLFLLIILVVVAMRKRIVFPMLRNKIINKLYEQDDQNVR